MTYAVVLYKNGHTDRCRAKDPNHCRYHTSSDVKTHLVFKDRDAADRYFEEKARKENSGSVKSLSKSSSRPAVCRSQTMSMAAESGKNVLSKADSRHRMLEEIYTGMEDHGE